MIRQCAVCKRILVTQALATIKPVLKVREVWLSPVLKDKSRPSEVTHTYCPTCEETMKEQLKRAAAGLDTREVT